MKSSFFIFVLLSALVHAIIIGMQDEWIFSISEYHEQGSPIVDVEITSKSNSTPITDSDIKKPETLTKKPQPKPRKNSKLTTPSLSTLSTSKKTASNIKIIDHKESRSTNKEPAAEKLPQTATPEHLSENQPDQKNTAPRNTHKNNNNETLKTLLNAELEKYFYYPKAAQRKNRQGSVILAFTINSDGEIENIH
ncbi:MAG TPA: hypothetical protein ENJ08_04525, partial [Gammaproteobacteria bacterium]|nr:hypothetical protein [Gammaproteobacteria bacterium]